MIESCTTDCFKESGLYTLTVSGIKVLWLQSEEKGYSMRKREALGQPLNISKTDPCSAIGKSAEVDCKSSIWDSHASLYGRTDYYFKVTKEK